MPDCLTEFQKRRSLLRELNFNDDKLRLSAFADWLESEVETKRIVDALRREVDAAILVPSRTGFPHPPSAKTPTEIRAFGLFLLDGCRKGRALYSQATSYNINRNARRAQEHIDAAMTKFIEPFLDFVQEELEKRAGAMTPEDVAELRFGTVFSPEFAGHFPRTSKLLENLGQFCEAAHANDSWFNVGNSCRETFQMFVEELRQHGLVVPDESLKKGDVKGHLRRFLGVTGSSSRHELALVELISSVWGLVSVTLHRSETTKEEALRAYLWTSLLLAELFAHSKSKFEASPS